MRLRAPRHVTAAWLATGPVAVRRGVLTLPNDPPQGDLRGLAAAGFVVLPPLIVLPASPRPATASEKN